MSCFVYSVVYRYTLWQILEKTKWGSPHGFPHFNDEIFTLVHLDGADHLANLRCFCQPEIGKHIALIHGSFAAFLSALRLRVNVVFLEQGCKILAILGALRDLICRFLIIDQNGCYLQFRIVGANLILLLCVVICHIRFIHRTFRCNGIIHQGIQIRGLHQRHKLFLIYLHLLQRIRIHCGEELLCRRCRFLLLVIRQRNIMRRSIFLRRKHTLQCADGALLHQLIRRLPIKIQIPDILSRRRNKALRCGIKVNHIFIFRNIVIVNFQHNRIRCSAAATGCQRKHPCQQKPKQTFSDVPPTHWAYVSVEKAVVQGLVTGVGGGKFEPSRTLNRAEFTTMLWRMAGSPKAENAAGFRDVEPGTWYSDAIDWAAEQGYVTGTGDSAFSPNASISRQEAVTILFRYSGGVSGAELMFSSMYDSQFTDSDSIAPWAESALDWAIYRGVITGTSQTTVSPTATATRAEAAALFVRYSEKIN